MDLLQLLYFRTVASLEHMTKAAEVLHVSQPSLSRTISNLEKELGTDLFYRTGRKITLNRYGKAFLAHVNIALNELQAGKDEILSMRGDSRPIAVSCVITGIITDLVDSYHQIDPTVSITFRIDPYDKIPALLKNNEVDFVISDMVLPDAPMDGWIHISNEHLYALVNREDSLAQESGIYLSQIQDRKLTLPESTAPIRGVLNHFFQISGMRLRPAYEINDVYTQLHLVEQGSAISLIPSSALYDIITKHDNAGYHAIDRVRAIPILDEAVTWHVAVSPLSARTPDVVAQHFYQHCLRTLARRQTEVDETLSRFCFRS